MAAAGRATRGARYRIRGGGAGARREGLLYARAQLKKSWGLAMAHAMVHVIVPTCMYLAGLVLHCRHHNVDSHMCYHPPRYRVQLLAPFEDVIPFILHCLFYTRQSINLHQLLLAISFLCLIFFYRAYMCTVSRLQATMQGAAVHVPVPAQAHAASPAANPCPLSEAVQWKRTTRPRDAFSASSHFQILFFVFF